MLNPTRDPISWMQYAWINLVVHNIGPPLARSLAVLKNNVPIGLFGLLLINSLLPSHLMFILEPQNRKDVSTNQIRVFHLDAAQIEYSVLGTWKICKQPILVTIVYGVGRIHI